MASQSNPDEDRREAEDLHYRQMYTEIKARAQTVLAAYRAAGIAEQIYHDSMSDIDVWAADYFRKHGHYGIKETAWIEKTLTLKVFKLGRLQFEQLENDSVAALIAVTGGGKNPLVLDTHIQAGAALDEAACEASYRAAAGFYAQRGAVFTNILFVCNSWLLNPHLHALLPANSNILNFQKKYTLLSHDDANRQMEERVFGEVLQNPADYPENTTLQKKLKLALLHGQTFGTAKGFFIQAVSHSPR